MKCIITIAFTLVVFCSRSQSVLNAYAKVNSITSGNVLAVNNVNTVNHSFNPGEKVIVMQMQDDVIGANTANNASFGNLASINMAGAFEIGIIASVSPSTTNPNVITLVSPLSLSFNANSNSSLQVITFRNLGNNYTTTSNITALPWNGNIGGVIAIEVNNILTLNHSVIADAVGFRGGAISAAAGGVCQPGLYKTNSTVQAYKGESIYKTSDATHLNGRAKIINGGGGGNEHNAGGGGGGNFSAGGEGGQGWGCGVSAGGLGGVALQTNINLNRFYMGGGGGGGQQNNNVSSPGGNGGGIIIVKANAIVTSTICSSAIRISANGGSAANSGNDGGGGGGAGGSVLVDAISYTLNPTCPLSITSNGGSGGSVNDGASHGGGGGGGQGVLLFPQNMPNTNATINTTYGTGGANNTPASTYAQSGGGPNNAGVFGSGVLPIELLSFNAIKNGNNVDAYWTTASELNNDYFTLERSKDGITFEKLVITDGAGNSNFMINYSETDFSPYEGISYYRLMQTDFSGANSYSKIVAVNYIIADDNISIYPNPADGGKFTINLKSLENKEVLVVLRDISGKEYFSKVMLVAEDSKIIGIDLEQKLAAGTYIVTASSNNLLYSQKLIIK